MKKIKTYILLIAVIGIWGTIAKRFIGNSFSDEIEPNSIKNVVEFKPNYENKKDTFSIQQVKKDPFLGQLTTPKRKNKSKTKKYPKDSLRVKISYSGMVKKQQSKDQVFVININQQQYLLKKGQKVKDVKLLFGNQNNIVVLNKGKRQTIKKQS